MERFGPMAGRPRPRVFRFIPSFYSVQSKKFYSPLDSLLKGTYIVHTQSRPGTNGRANETGGFMTIRELQLHSQKVYRDERRSYIAAQLAAARVESRNEKRAERAEDRQQAVTR